MPNATRGDGRGARGGEVPQARGTIPTPTKACAGALRVRALGRPWGSLRCRIGSARGALRLALRREGSGGGGRGCRLRGTPFDVCGADAWSLLRQATS